MIEIRTNRQKTMKKLHRSKFLKQIKKHFPEITEGINQQQGLLSFEIDIFIKYTQKQINMRNIDNTQLAFQLLDTYYRNGNQSLHELIRNSVCEDLDFSNTKKTERSWAYELLPESLKSERKEWHIFMGYTYI